MTAGVIKVSGTDASLTVNGPVTLDGGTISASSGGVASLTGLSSVGYFYYDPSINVRGPGSEIDLPNLTSLNNVTVSISESGSLVADQWTSLTNGLSVSGGTYSFNLTDFDGSSAYVYAGGSLTLGEVSSYSNESGNYAYFWAQGNDAVLSLPGLTSLGSL